MKYIDLFAGIGGFRYGIENIYKQQREGKEGLRFNGDKSLLDSLNGDIRNEQYQCVYSNEWDKYANSVYRKHYGQCDNKDIREVDAAEIPDFDLLCGGFPCQSFSIAGKRGGFNDTRGTLFFEIARIVKQKQPRLLLLENVKGLLSHDQGKTFATIIATLDELGYDIQWQVLNSKNFGVPQNRERVFIVGHLRGTSRPEVFPIFGTDKEITKTNEIAIPVLTPDRLIKRQMGRRFKKNGEESFTVTSQDRHGVYDGTTIRRLTPTECERLQGFPDEWTMYGANGETISDSQRYKMMGNAVTTNVITEIIKKIINNTK